MTAHDWYVENRAAFVARSLEPGEERTFRDHLVALRGVHRGRSRRLERELAWLPMGVAAGGARPGILPPRWPPRSSIGRAAGGVALPLGPGRGGARSLAAGWRRVSGTARGPRARAAARRARDPAGGA